MPLDDNLFVVRRDGLLYGQGSIAPGIASSLQGSLEAVGFKVGTNHSSDKNKSRMFGCYAPSSGMSSKVWIGSTPRRDLYGLVKIMGEDIKSVEEDIVLFLTSSAVKLMPPSGYIMKQQLQAADAWHRAMNATITSPDRRMDRFKCLMYKDFLMSFKKFSVIDADATARKAFGL